MDFAVSVFAAIFRCFRYRNAQYCEKHTISDWIIALLAHHRFGVISPWLHDCICPLIRLSFWIYCNLFLDPSLINADWKIVLFMNSRAAINLPCYQGCVTLKFYLQCYNDFRAMFGYFCNSQILSFMLRWLSNSVCLNILSAPN